ncbi:protein kinase domain-containing protein [Streptomyces sp. H27-D2]|uniref:protein kinase domain-containing protein n=1 Tax=Streptomyces sp. H27-D2 TaxID=3046304 RepID=UPI002DBCEAC5|nr:protein kinase [Streptomyces sp. H27-D2]MEC4016445.1 protein kinase [Streptomyces sp. H27-D2]
MDRLGPGDPGKLGAYRLLGRLGEGGMGRVYLARSDRGRTVAVKLVREELARQEEFRSRFRQEVRAALRVGGEWTAPVLDADTEADVPWVATGYVAGPSLHQVVAADHGPLPERTVRILAAGLARALQAIHGTGIIHRDLKPSNVLLTIDGPRVIDFGIARALEVSAADGGLTTTGAAVGSPGFMSPEQVRGEPLTAASDVFCLGSVLAYAATGRTPFGTVDSGVHALMYRIAQETPDLEALPEGLRELIAACLTKEPGVRLTPAQVLERTRPDADPSDEPWLPGTLIARLGRHAVELLEAENPRSDTDGAGSPLAQGAGPASASGGAALAGAGQPATPGAGPGSGAGSGSALTWDAATGAGPQGRHPAQPGQFGPPRYPGPRDLHDLPTMYAAGAAGTAPASQNPAHTPPHPPGATPSGGYGTMPPSAGYGYPNPGGYGTPGGIRTPPPTPQPGYVYAQPTPEPSRRGGALLMVLVALVLALGGGAVAYLLLSDGDKQQTAQAKPPKSAQRDNAASGAPGSANDDDASKTPKPEADGSLPSEYVGTWQANVGSTDSDTSQLTVTKGGVGDTVLSVVAEGPNYHCEFEADLTAVGPPVELGPSTVTSKTSDESCKPGVGSTLELTEGGSLRRTLTGSDRPPLTYARSS